MNGNQALLRSVPRSLSLYIYMYIDGVHSVRISTKGPFLSENRAIATVRINRHKNKMIHLYHIRAFLDFYDGKDMEMIEYNF